MGALLRVEMGVLDWGCQTGLHSMIECHARSMIRWWSVGLFLPLAKLPLPRGADHAS